MTQPAIKAIAPWFGSKRTLAPTIVEELGPHRVYWEPLCGSMAVLIFKTPCVMETVNDLHGDLVNLARVIQDETLGPKLYRRLRRTLMCETLHREAAARHRERGYMGDGPPDVDSAYDYFLCAWLGRNGVAGTSSYNQGFCLRLTANGGHSATRWTSVVDSIPAWRKRLRNVTILCRDAFELLPRIDDARGTAIYVDPPYIVKGAKYVHDFDEFVPDPDNPDKLITKHELLSKQLARFRRARVVVSYYDHIDLSWLYPSDLWTMRRLDVTKSLVNQGMRDGKGGVKAPEVLLLNGPSYAKQDKTLF